VRRSLCTRDRAEAQRRLKSILADAERIRFGEEGRRTYQEAALGWVSAGYGGVRPRSAERYRTSLRQLHETFAPLHLDQITTRKIGEYVRARQRDGVSNATIRRDLSALSRLIAYACAMGWAQENPARAWDRSIIRERRFLIRRLDPASFEAAVAAAAPVFAAYMRFLLATGLRADEAASIRRASLDWTGAALTVAGKTGVRTIALSPEALAIARAVPASLHSPFLFWAGHDGRYANPSARFASIRAAAQKAAQRAGRPFQPFRLHDLRHEYAIRWVEAGRSLYRLQKHLGHSSVRTTELYTQYISPEQAERAKHGMGEEEHRGDSGA
jgi:integrase/recombinase XerD